MRNMCNRLSGTPSSCQSWTLKDRKENSSSGEENLLGKELQELVGKKEEAG